MTKHHNKSKKNKKNGGNRSPQATSMITSPLKRYGITSEISNEYSRAVAQKFPQATKIMDILSYNSTPPQSDKQKLSEINIEVDFRKSVIASNLKQLEQYHLSKSPIEKEALLKILNISSLENFNDIEAVLNAFTQYSQTADRYYTELKHILKNWEKDQENNPTGSFLVTAMQIRFICIAFTKNIKREFDKIKTSVSILNEEKRKEEKNKNRINSDTLIGQSTIFENPSISIIEQAIHDKYFPTFSQAVADASDLVMTQTVGNFTANISPQLNNGLFTASPYAKYFVTAVLFQVTPKPITEEVKNNPQLLDPCHFLIELATSIYEETENQHKKIKEIFAKNETFNLENLCTTLVGTEAKTNYTAFLSKIPRFLYDACELRRTTDSLYSELESIFRQWIKFSPVKEGQRLEQDNFGKHTEDEQTITLVLYMIKDWTDKRARLINKLTQDATLWHDLLNGKTLDVQACINITKSFSNFPREVLEFSESTSFIQKNLKCILGPESHLQEITDILTQLSEKPSAPPVIETSPSTSEEPVITPPAQDNSSVSNESATPVEEHAEIMLPQENKAEGKQEEADDIINPESKDLEIEEEILDPVQIHNQYQLYKLQHKLSSTQTSPPAPNKKVLTNQQIAYLQIIEKNGYKDLLLDLFRIDIDSDRKFKMGKLFKLFSDLGGQVVATKGSACRLSLGNEVSGGNHKVFQEIEKSDVATNGFHLKHGKDKNAPVFRYVADIFKDLLIEVGCAPWELYSNEYNSQEIEQIKDFHVSRLKKIKD